MTTQEKEAAARVRHTGCGVCGGQFCSHGVCRVCTGCDLCDAPAGTCRYCGCTDTRACRVPRAAVTGVAGDRGTLPCAWADAAKTVCTNPECLRRHAAAYVAGGCA